MGVGLYFLLEWLFKRRFVELAMIQKLESTEEAETQEDVESSVEEDLSYAEQSETQEVNSEEGEK
jgi:hypothetical protein